MKTTLRTSVLLSVLTVSGLMSLAAPAQAQRVCVVTRYNQVSCTNRDDYRYNRRPLRVRQPIRVRVGVRQEVRDVYEDVLGRDADRRGLRDWSRTVIRQGNSLDDVREGIANSDEAKNRINDIYRDVLGRDAEPEGLKTWTGALEDGESLDDVRREIQESDEARSRNP
ncbi:MAG: DUF4214 domain-containing protein [Symplocastrum torsivum CPER-KK1]|jgi:hypothetical protein|uniref:DUF4214 domain-containing protein n=1 Tax=Symplocastrum torsivum CPER-KK1 TaxID=450513 RepID=A0A951UBG0_9CYAN|nr:DUF4214 domain-containing protein [Symplocastrum torsivum CPER-KK1]